MLRKALAAIGIAVAVSMSFASAPSIAGDAAAGEDVFKKKCKSCHDLEKDKTGPALGGVVGRKAGSAEFKRYKGLVDADFEWTPELLDEWIKDPKAFVEAHTQNKSTSMTFKLADDGQRADVIEYLKTAK
ncbi:MAG: c-type cytochrome [Rhodospirillales bacterium]|nr:c-type cytochrome [Rhodospirillales bacterium]